MTYRKTWFSYALWFLYSILCALLLMYAGHVWIYYFAGKPYMKSFPDSLAAPFAGMSNGALLVIGLLIIPAAVAIYWLVRWTAIKVGTKCVWKKSVITGFECAIVLLIMVGGIFLRVESARFEIEMSEQGFAVENGLSSENEEIHDANVQSMTYYNMAVVTQERSGLSMICYSVRELYVICLSAVLSFLGNKIASAVIMQVFLQIIGMLLVYAVTRKLAGRIPACAALLYLACSLGCLEMLSLFRPDWLFFDLYMIGMLAVVSFVKGYCANRLGRPAAMAVSAVIGVIIGALAYLDIMAATLLIVMAAVFIGEKTRQEDKPLYHSVPVSVSVFLVALLVSVFVRGLMIGIIYGNSGMALLGSIVEQWRDLKYLPASAFTARYPYVYDIYLMGMLVIPASFLVFEFIRSGRKQNYMLWILFCLLAAPTPMASIGSEQSGLLSLYIWSVLAGLGLQNCIFGGKAAIVQMPIEEVDETAVIKETGNKPDDAELEWVEWNEGTMQAETPEITEDLEMIDLTEAPKKPEKPRYFENPLPLPKKHVRREMDYQYPVEEKDMKYDVEIAYDDDFDIP
ncbi:MAG: hypothetical protein NC416_10090 [Eubacterium sp.]|nr:hypothetical protein [Eubacterium sp.]